MASARRERTGSRDAGSEAGLGKVDHEQVHQIVAARAKYLAEQQQKRANEEQPKLEPMPAEYVALLREALDYKGWSMAELGRHLGASRSAVTKWFAGEHRPDKRHVPKLSTYFGVPQMRLWRFYVDTPKDMPTWETMRLADIITLPEGTTRRALELVLAQLPFLFPSLISGATVWLAEMDARAEQAKEQLRVTMEMQRRRQASDREVSPQPASSPEGLFPDFDGDGALLAPQNGVGR